MARWIDDQGVEHNTDNLEYGNQGDTRYWSGTPGEAGSASYDRPVERDDSGAVTNGAQVIHVATPTMPSVTWNQPRQPSYGFDWSGVPKDSLLYQLYQGLSSPDPARGQTGTVRALGVPQPQVVTNASRAPGIPRGDASLNDTVYSELAARAYAQMKGISLEQARVDIQMLPTVKQTLIQAASSGQLDHLAPELAGTPIATGPNGAIGVADTTGLDQVAQAAGYPSWQEYSAALQEGARQKAEMDKRKAEQDLALARNADERAAAMLEITQANQRLAESQYETSKQQYATNLMQQLLATASQLRGPTNYAQFMQFSRGAQDLLSQLFGDQALAAFTAPVGGLDSPTVGNVLAQLGIGGGTLQTTAASTRVPLPYQINPGVWDSLGTVGQQMVLSAAEAAGYDPTEFVRQVNAARPVGTASRQTRYTFAAPAAA
jgi:hypothetical protein